MLGDITFCHACGVGNHTRMRNALRDCIYRLSLEADLRSQLETPGLLPAGPQRRPAHAFLPSTTPEANILAQVPELALDCAIVQSRRPHRRLRRRPQRLRRVRISSALVDINSKRELHSCCSAT